jgi:hypothetical protein
MSKHDKATLVLLGLILTAIIIIFPVFISDNLTSPNFPNSETALSSNSETHQKPTSSNDDIGGPGQGIFTEYYSVESPQNIPWKRYGVVLDVGKPGEYDSQNVESPLIMKLKDGSYVMFYRGQTFKDKIGRIMRATSIDGINWNKTGVVMEPQYPYEGDKVDPMAVILENGVYKMWYGSSAYGGCTCYATSSDGIQWTKYQGNPVLRKTSGYWDNEGAGGQLTILKVGNIYRMYYKGYGSAKSGWTFYGLAESNDGTTWMKKEKVISPQPELSETTTFKNLYAFQASDSCYLMHTMANYLDLFLLQSDDCRTSWSKKGVIFRHGLTPGGWDIKWATSPCLIIDGAILKMWYEGGDPNGRVRTLYAEVNADLFFKVARNTSIVVKN